MQEVVDAPVTSKEVSFEFKDEILLVHTGLAWCSDLIAEAEAVGDWSRATIVNAAQPAYHHEDRNNDVLTVSGASNPALLKYEHLLVQVVHQCAGLYRALNNSLAVSKDTGFQLLRYLPGQHFHVHVDNVSGHPTWGQRQLSVVLYLNDDYIGGEIEFPRQRRKIKPRAGDMVLFPSHFTHPHASIDVQAGTKYAVVSWFV